MTQGKLGFAELNALTPYQVLENETVKERFVSLYSKLHHSNSGETFYEKEKYNFIRIIQASDNLQKCTGFSIYGCFLDVASMNLSMEQSSKPLMYVLFYSVNIGNNWAKRATIDISPYGELALRMRAGQLKHADHPIVLYKGDHFQPKEVGGVKSVDYIPKIPRESKEIIGGFIALTRPDGSKEYFWMLQEEIDRLKKYSNKKNRGSETEDKSNKLYTSNNGQIDPGFLEAKIIKHAFSAFPKIKTGEFSKLGDKDPDPISYGLEEAVHSQTPTATPAPAQEAAGSDPPPAPEAFGGEPQADADGVIIEDTEEVF